MATGETTKPIRLFSLSLPYGISTGFASTTLPFFVTRAGFSVASAIVALGVAANVWLFCWGPIVDLTLTPRPCYLLAIVVAAATLFLLGNMLNSEALVALVFVSAGLIALQQINARRAARHV